MCAGSPTTPGQRWILWAESDFLRTARTSKISASSAQCEQNGWRGLRRKFKLKLINPGEDREHTDTQQVMDPLNHRACPRIQTHVHTRAHTCTHLTAEYLLSTWLRMQQKDWDTDLHWLHKAPWVLQPRRSITFILQKPWFSFSQQVSQSVFLN